MEGKHGVLTLTLTLTLIVGPVQVVERKHGVCSDSPVQNGGLPRTGYLNLES